MKDGVINIDKPAGWTSHDVVAKLRGILKVGKVGHTGTLDPDATGVLPVCFGKGTKIVSFLMEGEKEYEVVLRLGAETETQDASGKVTRTAPVPDYPQQRIDEVLLAYTGVIEQIPPMYSAVKINGRPLYKAARAGQVIERAPRRITIHEIIFHKKEGDDLFFNVVCSKGTYIRALCADIGTELGAGGHLLRLRRVRSGSFHVSDAIEMERFYALRENGGWESEVYSLNEALEAVPAIWIKESALRKVKHGAAVGWEGLARWDSFIKGAPLRLLDSDGTLVAIGAAKIASSEIEKQEKGTFVFKIETVLSETEESASTVKL